MVLLMPEASGFPDAALPLAREAAFLLRLVDARCPPLGKGMVLLSRENRYIVFLGFGRGESKQIIFRNAVL